MLRFEMSGYPAAGEKGKHVSVRAGDTAVAEWSVEPGGFHRYRATLPQEAIKGGLTSIVLALPDSTIPARQDGSSERWRLGINLRSVTLPP